MTRSQSPSIGIDAKDNACLLSRLGIYERLKGGLYDACCDCSGLHRSQPHLTNREGFMLHFTGPDDLGALLSVSVRLAGMADIAQAALHDPGEALAVFAVPACIAGIGVCVGEIVRRLFLRKRATWVSYARDCEPRLSFDGRPDGQRERRREQQRARRAAKRACSTEAVPF